MSLHAEASMAERTVRLIFRKPKRNWQTEKIAATFLCFALITAGLDLIGTNGSQGKEDLNFSNAVISIR